MNSAEAPTLDPADAPTISVTAEPGAVICGHRLDALLGKGGFGSVYRAVDLALERPVAFKILGRSDAGMLARFRDEAKILARLDDPHIVRVYRIGQLPSGEPFISMELFGDGSLDGLIERGRRMELERSAPIIEQMLAGLQTAHDAGIVHRDIKEANVLIDSATGQAKLCDFGIARATQGAREAQTDGVLLGTPYYIAPERFRGIGDDPRSDIYAVGVVFYRLLTGQRPFETPGASALVIARRAATEEVPPPVHVPRAVARVCVQMLHRDPDLRYPSAGAALQALRDALTSEPTASRVLDELPPGPVAPPRNPRRALLIAGAATASVLASWFVVRSLMTPPIETGVLDAGPRSMVSMAPPTAPVSVAPASAASITSVAPVSIATPRSIAPKSAAPKLVVF